jgi:hypothetical protein
MSTADDAAKLAQVLAKQGKATISINLVAYANDMDFPENRPSCRVKIQVRDPANDNSVIHEGVLDVQTNQPPYSCKFTIPVQTAIKSLGRFFGFTRHRPLRVDVAAAPVGGFETYYESDSSNAGLTIQAGTSLDLNISLKPKYEGSRLNQPIRLNKPKLT